MLSAPRLGTEMASWSTWRWFRMSRRDDCRMKLWPKLDRTLRKLQEPRALEFLRHPSHTKSISHFPESSRMQARVCACSLQIPPTLLALAKQLDAQFVMAIELQM